MSNFLRPTLSMRKRMKMMVMTVLTTPKMPVVRNEVFVPLMPMLAKTVGEK